PRRTLAAAPQCTGTADRDRDAPPRPRVAWCWRAADTLARPTAAAPSAGSPGGRPRPRGGSGAAGWRGPISARSSGCRPSPARSAPATPSRGPDLFFDRRAAAPRPALALDRDVGQGTGDFLLAPADRLLVQAGDLGDQPHAAAPLAIRLDGSIPPALGLVEAAEQQIHLGVQHPVG